VSSHHCVIGRDPSGAIVVQDHGSTNGTWVGQQRIQGSVVVQPGARLTVGSYVIELELEPARALTGAAPIVSRAIAPTARGSLIRGSEDELASRRLRARVRRYAEEWDAAGRPSKLLLRGRNLRQALDLLELGGDPDEVFSELDESFVRASAEARERGKVLRVVAIAGGSLAAVGLIAVLATRDWSGDEDEVVAVDGAGETGTGETGDDSDAVRKVDSKGTDPLVHEREKVIEHLVIPAETLQEIAFRYQVSLNNLERWNGIDESESLEPGTKIEVRTKLDPLPLPQQQITYRPDKRESWTSLATRFDVPVAKLQAYNPGVEGNIARGTELTIWIDPKPLERKQDIQLPKFTVPQDALSVGEPQAGSIENPIQFPENEALYKRRNPRIMYCASYMAENLQFAVAKFRYTYDFEGDIVIADMSRKGGGKFPPHKSHQAGRDVDIWMPTIKGVYQPSHIREGKERKPFPEETDWFALYGFTKALGETGSVEAIFLDESLHDRVYNAAQLMGADQEELEQMISRHPDGSRHPNALITHSPGHTRHFHVRFKCGPNDEQCKRTRYTIAGD